ncbi:flavin reductase family protein [Rhizobium sp. RAF56]|uniref:flavin reductase family protein n=1 Tax=Rhizobium sp. RAF56 TaxID=3233062 RepID=UPI003F9E4703
MSKDAFRSGMRRVSGAVTVVTTRGVNGELRGVTATAVCSLTVDPPAVIACINRGTWVGQLAPESGVFCVNVLSLDQTHVAEAFAGRTVHSGEERFKIGEWSDEETGAPVLNHAIASFDCELDQAVEFATHVILIGHVKKTVVGPENTEPLLYVDGSFTTTAASPATPLPTVEPASRPLNT